MVFLFAQKQNQCRLLLSALKKRHNPTASAVEAPWPLLEVAVCAFSKSICETVRLASRPDRPFQTIVRYDGDKQRFLSKTWCCSGLWAAASFLDILHERPLAEVHLRMVGTSGKTTVRRVNIDNYMDIGDKQ